MTIARKKMTRGFRWVIAIVVFILTMTITFSDVYGAGF